MKGNMLWIGIFTLVMLALGLRQFFINRRKRRAGGNSDGNA
jgi:hypothetical protein